MGNHVFFYHDPRQRWTEWWRGCTARLGSFDCGSNNCYRKLGDSLAEMENKEEYWKIPEKKPLAGKG